MGLVTYSLNPALSQLKVMAVTSFASGALVTTQGWQLLNIGSMLPVALTAAALHKCLQLCNYM